MYDTNFTDDLKQVLAKEDKAKIDVAEMKKSYEEGLSSILEDKKEKKQKLDHLNDLVKEHKEQITLLNAEIKALSLKEASIEAKIADEVVKLEEKYNLGKKKLVLAALKDEHSIGKCLGMIEQIDSAVKCEECNGELILSSGEDSKERVDTSASNKEAISDDTKLLAFCSKCQTESNNLTSKTLENKLKIRRLANKILKELKETQAKAKQKQPKIDLTQFDSVKETIEKNEVDMNAIISGRSTQINVLAEKLVLVENLLEKKEDIKTDPDTKLTELTTNFINLKAEVEKLKEAETKNEDKVKAHLLDCKGHLGILTQSTQIATNGINYNTFFKKSVFNISNGKILEIKDNNGEINLVEREKMFEKDDFVFWIEDKQLCCSIEESLMVIRLYCGNFEVDKKTLSCSNYKSKFFKRENKVFIALRYTFELFKLTVENRKIVLSSLGKTAGFVRQLVVEKESVFIGTQNNLVQKVELLGMTDVVKMSGPVTSLDVKDNILRAVDFNGVAVKHNLSTGIDTSRIELVGNANFIIGPNVGATSSSKLIVQDWKGTTLLEKNIKAATNLHILEQFSSHTVLACQNNVYVINHETLKLEHHKVSDIRTNYTSQE